MYAMYAMCYAVEGGHFKASRPWQVWTLLASKACRYATMVGKAGWLQPLE